MIEYFKGDATNQPSPGNKVIVHVCIVKNSSDAGVKTTVYDF